VRGKRAARSRTITSVEEVDRAIRRVTLDCLEVENSVEHAPVLSGHSAPAADAGADAARRTAEVSEQCAAELVPFVMIAQDRALPAVEHAIAQ
jgi:hypothetical protein